MIIAMHCILIFTLSRQAEMLKEAVFRCVNVVSVWRDRQKISILVELTVCHKNVDNALNSVGIILKTKV